jgi:hypothetical protein
VLSIKNIAAAGLILMLFSCHGTEKEEQPGSPETSSFFALLPEENLQGTTPSSGTEEPLAYPPFTIPQSPVKPEPFTVSRDTSACRFTPSDAVKNEKIAFKALVDPPEITERHGNRYVLVTADGIAIYTQPTERSKPVGTARAGELFILRQEQNLPGKPEDLPATDYEKLKERFELEWEFFLETYGRQPGVIVEGYYNTWIKVSNDRVTGWIFRAYTCESSYKNLLFLRELYRRGSVFSSYQDYVIGPVETESQESVSSYYEEVVSRKQLFSRSLKQALTSHYVVYEKTDAGMVSFSSAGPDDMLLLYIDAAGSYLNPLFITTDLVIHTFLIIMGRAIAEIEEYYFLPFIRRVMRYYFNRLALYTDHVTDEKMRRSADVLLGYFGMGLHLLGELTEEDRSRCGFEVLRKLMNEASLLEGDARYELSPLLNKKIDYSAFDKTRYSHLPAEMQRYVAALSWCSMLSFDLTVPDDTRTALLLAMLMTENGHALADYTFSGRAIAFLKGGSEMPTILELISLCDTLDRARIFEGISRDYIIKHVMDSAAVAFLHDTHEDILIKQGEDAEGEALSHVITFLGRPSSLDQVIFAMLSHPNIPERQHVQCLDIAASFGSALARKYLLQDIENFDDMQTRISEINRYISHRKEERWFRNYTDALFMVIQQIMVPKEKTGVPWFDCETYARKNLVTFSGSFTESRQPLILEDTKAEALLGEFDGTVTYEYRRDPLPSPRGYIEPRYGFFNNLLMLHNTLAACEAGTLLFCSRMAESLTAFFQEVEWMRFMVQNEKEGKQIEPFDYDHIFEIPELFARCCFPENFFFTDETVSAGFRQHRMAGITELYSSAFHQHILAGGLGIPKRLYITIFDPDGGRRVCIGYAYSYFELWDGSDEIPDNAKWNILVYSKAGKKNELPWTYEPSWARSE